MPVTVRIWHLQAEKHAVSFHVLFAEIFRHRASVLAGESQQIQTLNLQTRRQKLVVNRGFIKLVWDAHLSFLELSQSINPYVTPSISELHKVELFVKYKDTYTSISE